MHTRLWSLIIFYICRLAWRILEQKILSTATRVSFWVCVGLLCCGFKFKIFKLRWEILYRSNSHDFGNCIGFQWGQVRQGSSSSLVSEKNCRLHWSWSTEFQHQLERWVGIQRSDSQTQVCKSLFYGYCWNYYNRPDLIDFDELNPNDPIACLNNAFDVAERELGLPRLLDAEGKYSTSTRLVLRVTLLLLQIWWYLNPMTSPSWHT